MDLEATEEDFEPAKTIFDSAEGFFVLPFLDFFPQNV